MLIRGKATLALVTEVRDWAAGEVDAVSGIFAAETAGDPSSEEIRAQERADEADEEERRFGR